MTNTCFDLERNKFLNMHNPPFNPASVQEIFFSVIACTIWRWKNAYIFFSHWACIQYITTWKVYVFPTEIKFLQYEIKNQKKGISPWNTSAKPQISLIPKLNPVKLSALVVIVTAASADEVKRGVVYSTFLVFFQVAAAVQWICAHEGSTWTGVASPSQLPMHCQTFL